MPGVGRYPCKLCRYVGNNRRMLARHVALIHSEKVFKCPVCPFVTRYAANWYRHKRSQHGLSKLTTCETCGFFAQSTEELAEHKESDHPEDSHGTEEQRSVPDIEGVQPDALDLDDGASPPRERLAQGESVTFSLPMNGFLAPGDHFGSNVGSTTPGAAAMNNPTSSSNLRPLRVRRSYSCDRCGLLTNNPREFLYHQRNVHGEKISVHECKYCVYASKHVQKLQRHCSLVHRQQLAKDPEYQKQLEASKEKRAKPEMIAYSLSASDETFHSGVLNKPVVRSRPTSNLLKCSECPYQTRNKSLLFHHEKTSHLKKRFYRCLQCGYVTNEKGRYTKHIKYHSLPKMQCEFCFFKTAYKWNMDRHMKNHEEGAEGEFRCSVCNFTTSTKQSFKSHVTNHHDPSADDVAEIDIDNMNGQNEFSDWEDIDYEESVESSMQLDENASMEPYEFSEMGEVSDMAWKDGKAYEKSLKCKSCDFKAAWPFELKKHEETHKNQKKHPCPLCGMRFEHIAWLTKHLRRVHRESSQAKNIAAAFDLLKPNRRRPGKEYAADTVLPMFQEVLKQNNIVPSKPQEPAKPSMLSSLLKKPLQTFSSPTYRYSTSFKSRSFGASSSMSRQPKISNFYEKMPPEDSFENSGLKSKSVPTCNVCGYKTRWISELQRHMRVHSQEKPFHCHKCKYHCKWKGDLNRHLMKYHGIKVPSAGKKQIIPKMKLKKAPNVPTPVNDWQNAKRQPLSSTPLRKEDDSPLDLTLAKETFPHPFPNENVYDAYDFESQSALDSDPIDTVCADSNSPGARYSPFKSPLAQLREASFIPEDSPAAGTKRRYQCPFCTFGTTTASRFHVHIVQHYNRRPFMCSVCGYNSNWEWDITKHIRLKGCRDRSHNKACVLLTDETGRRNYEKYEKYLTDVDQSKPSEAPINLPEVNNMQDNMRFNANHPSFNNTINKSCSYDFRNIGSNFEEPQPENIVVTPDIDLSEPQDVMDIQSDALQMDLIEDVYPESNDSKSFYCKHCNFKHSTKRVVISHLSVHTGIKPFRCRSCGISSNWRHVIVRHVKDVHNGYMNDVEERINYVQEGYALRLTSINSENPAPNDFCSQKPSAEQYCCKICPYKCDKEFYMKFHMKQHRPREGAVCRCDYCPYFVKFKKTLNRHMKLHNVPPQDDLNSDGSSILMNSGFSGSQTSHYQNDLYQYYDNDQNELDGDSIVISFDKLNQSDHVEQSSTPKIKRHVCDHCPYKTDNKTQYLYHKQFHRPNPSAAFKCTICTYWATMQHLLTQHMKVHSDADSSTEEQNVGSESPQKAYAKEEPAEEEYPELFDNDPNEKKTAVYVKRGDLIVKMFKCQFCPMMNKKRANVRVHQKMHGVIVNDGKFACTYCDYQCLNQGGLTNHIKIHQKVPEKHVEESELASDSPKKVPDPPVEENRKGYSYFCMGCPAVFKSSSDLQIHSKFHGATLPFPCTQCDYRARNKPHLTKHVTVHGAEYGAKRAAAENQNADSAKTNFTDSGTFRTSAVKKVDQMLLLEASEMKGAFKKSGETCGNLHKCVLCPALFFKTSTLAYHISLHGSDGEFKCSQCDYAVSRSSNLTTHSQVHPKKAPVKRALKTFPCPKCPAIFYKQDRYDRHQLLHGKNYKFQCQYCDYSVRFAANLIKHRNLHLVKNAENIESPSTANSGNESLLGSNPLTENTNIQYVGERKTVFICDRCPYSQTRKDAVQSHQRRHWLSDGFKCPYCDYTSMQNGFLQSHIKMHIQPSLIFPPHAFIKYEAFKIFCKEDDNETLLFDDENMEDSPSDEAEDEIEETEVETPKSKIIPTIATPPPKPETSSKRKLVKFSHDIFKTDENSLDSNASSNSKVPVVVLSDIFANSKDLKKYSSQLKIPKLIISKRTDTTKSNSKDAKPSLVVKIKVENCLVNKHEKTLYSVATSPCDIDSSRTMESLESPENTNDSTSDIVFRDAEQSPQALPSVIPPLPVDIEEETTLTSTSGISDTLRAAEDVDDLIDSIVGTGADDLIPPRNLNDLSDTKSDDSFSNDTVPVVVGEICEKLNDLGEISFKDELMMNKTSCTNHITNGLMHDEIKIDL